MISTAAATRGGSAMALSMPQCLLWLCLTFCVGAAPASAQSRGLAREAQFDIPAQPLSLAIIEFSDQARIQVISAGTAVEKVKTPGVSGKLRIIDALQAILQGTGMKYALVNEETISISPDSWRSVAAEKSTAVRAATKAAAGKSWLATLSADDGVLESVEVTATRVLRDGYEAPTPTTVMGTDMLALVAPSNVADAVNTLPSIAGSATPRTGNTGVSGGQAGTNSLDLRSMGANRTLVLLDGKRVVAQSLTGVVDINQFPNGLIERVDVVTGGASAAYGSDAMSGVVNFVLDKNFTGFKTNVMAGGTTHGDDAQYKTSVTAGLPFAAGRGHFLISTDYSHSAGITGNPRSWYRGWKVIANPAYMPTNGQPQYITRPSVGLSQATPGALITSTPLQGTQFGTGGAVGQFQYGSIVSDPLMVGGDWLESDIGRYGDLEGAVERANVFTRGSFRVADATEVFAEASYAESQTETQCCRQFNLGDITIQRDNAFLPDSIRNEMTNLGLTSFMAGSTNADLGPIATHSDRSVRRFVIGAAGHFNALGSGWDWDAYAQRGISRVHNDVFLSITQNYRDAIDAVRDANGRIVCRSTLTDPDNGCVPYDVLGVGVNSPAAVDYVLGTAQLDQELTQDVVATSFNGEPLATWAGPVSLATGVEYRKESVESSADPLAVANQYFAANFKATNGSYDVVEGFLETVVPLAVDRPWARSLDLNAAARWTDYSTSGEVVTWKIGANWSPFKDLTFRATRSRDIRAPNLNELFLAGQVNTQTVNDPFRGNATTVILRPQVGNLNLKPEAADTTGIGLVYQPSFVPGLSMSADYYDIDVKDAISTILQQQIIDRCFNGNTALCPAIVRDAAGVVTQITVQPINLSSEVAEGLDLEASYRKPLWNGELSLRALATHVIKRKLDDGISVTDLAGDNAAGVTSAAEGSAANWRFLGMIGYDRGSYGVTLIGRGVSAGVLDNSNIECTTGCPPSTVNRKTIDNNHVKGALYADLSLVYRPVVGDHKTEVFLKVDNLADTAPAVVPSNSTLVFIDSGTNPLLYDTVGRTIRAGVRFLW
ncbi:MAG TPA: TonB-dependent receptor [Steroidobacteraceae bacterium]|jgi:outer membrane receptor protein involved in Fe transport